MARKPDRELTDLLHQVTDYSDAVISAMAQSGAKLNIPDRWSVMAESTPADMAYVLLAGEAEVRKDGKTIASLAPGSIFGEIALLEHKLRSASVFAATPITVLRLDAASLQKIVDDHADFAADLKDTAGVRSAES